MTEQQIKLYILRKQVEKQRLDDIWNRVLDLDDISKLNEETIDEIKTKISSLKAQCEISIRDHEKLIKQNSNEDAS